MPILLDRLLYGPRRESNPDLPAWQAGVLTATLRDLKNGDSYGTRTRVTAVKGRCLNRLTKEPFLSTR